MATHIFVLNGCTQQKAAQVEAAIAGIPGVTRVSVKQTARGEWLAVVESDLDEDVLLGLINAAIAHLGVTARKNAPAARPPGP